MIATGAENDIKLLAPKPGIKAVDVLRISLKSIAGVPAVNEYVALQNAEFFVSSVSVTDNNQSHSLLAGPPPNGSASTGVE
jgi:hypothetical protein